MAGEPRPRIEGEELFTSDRPYLDKLAEHVLADLVGLKQLNLHDINDLRWHSPEAFDYLQRPQGEQYAT